MPETPFGLVVNRVCRDCNAGWMNELDTAVQPWLLAYPDSVRNPTADERPQLLRWAVKTAMMRAFVDGDNSITPASDYSTVMRGNVPPKWDVWLGRSVSPSLLHAHLYAGPIDVPNDRFSIQHTSWVLGHAVLMVFRIEGTKTTGILPEFRAKAMTNVGDSIADLSAGERLGPASIPNFHLPGMFWSLSPA